LGSGYINETFNKHGEQWLSNLYYTSEQFDKIKFQLQKFFPMAIIKGVAQKPAQKPDISFFIHVSVYFKDKADEAEFLIKIGNIEINMN